MWTIPSVVVLLLLGGGSAALATAETTDFRSQSAVEIRRHAKAAEMLNYMRVEVAPCDDFYAYACGNWGRVHPARLAPDGQTNVFGQLAQAYDRRAGRLLSASKLTSESEMVRRVKYFYESCVGEARARSRYREQLLSVMAEFGGMPALWGAGGDRWPAEQFDWLDVTARILRKYGVQSLIGVSIAQDLTSRHRRLYVGQLEEGLEAWRVPAYAEHARWQRQHELQTTLGMAAPLAAQTAREMIDFERRLARGAADPLEGLGMEDLTRLRLLDEMSEAYEPTLNVTRFVATWLGHEYRLPVYEYVERYLVNLRKLVEDTPKRVVVNHIMWHLLDEFRIETVAGAVQRADQCVSLTKRYFPQVVEQMVYEQLVAEGGGGDQIVAELAQLWSQLVGAFERVLNANTTTTAWLSVATRDKALEKLAAMTFAISSAAYTDADFDSEYGALLISTDAYFENVVRVMTRRGHNLRQRLHEPPRPDDDTVARTSRPSPLYSAQHNRVLVPVSFILPHHLWSDVYPLAQRFAAVGFVVAHEIAHGFTDNGRRYDAAGALNNWWDRASSEAFAVRKDCLRQQLGEFRRLSRVQAQAQAQDENIADNIALRIAHDAYETWLGEHATTLALLGETLPRIDLTPRQFFFVALAQLWCGDVDAAKATLWNPDVHAPGEVRVKAIVSNSEAFAAEFKCPAASPMNPARKCNFY